MSLQKQRADNRIGTIAFLTQASHIFAQGLNLRDFDPASPHWQLVADNFEADFDHPVLGRVRRDLSGTLEMLRDLVAKYPEHQSSVSHTDVRLRERDGQADVFSVMESTGSPPGQVRESFVSQLWEKIDGQWRCTRYSGIRGMADGAIAEWWGGS